MKKTIVAAAVAAVFAAPAMADVSISGQVSFEAYDNDEASTGQSSQTFTDLVFKGSEDLGNGLKASFKYHLYHDQAVAGTTANSVANTTVAISGDFGEIMGGRFEMSNMALFEGYADVASSNAIGLENTYGDTSGRDIGAGIQYTSPSFNGLTVVAAAKMSTVDASGTPDAAGENLDATDITVKYSNGPLAIAVGQFNQADQTASSDMKVTNIGVTYKMGDLTAKVLRSDVENDAGVAANDGDTTTVGLTYAMGNNTIAFGFRDSDVAEDDGDQLIKLTHSLSKSTSLYVQHRNDDEANHDVTLVGMKHSF